MEVKGFELKRIDSGGSFEAVFATLNVVDKDGDVTLPGAFGAQEVAIIPGHNWGSVPLGKGRILERGNEAVVIGRFNQTPTAQEWRDALKFDLENGSRPLQEWSYGFVVADSEPGLFDGRRVRFLKRLKVHEVSPVLVGAGENTRTLAAKGYDQAEAEQVVHEGLSLLAKFSNRASEQRGQQELRQIQEKLTASRNSRYGYVYVPGSKRYRAAFTLTMLASKLLALKVAPVPYLFRPAIYGERPDFTSGTELLGQANTGQKLKVRSVEAPVIRILDAPGHELVATIGHECFHEHQVEKGLPITEPEAEEWGQWFANQFALPTTSELSLEPGEITPADLQKGRAWLDLSTMKLCRAGLDYYGRPAWLPYRELEF